MSNVAVTILQNGRCDDFGNPLVAGSSYSLDYDRAKSLWQAGFAYVTDPALFDKDNSSPSILGTVKYLPFSGFKKCLLASLVTNSTASRSNGLVTVTATGHGITTGATYQGFRFFYPGSTSLAAGWYDSVVAIPDANTITFFAPGDDFGSQSVNGAAAYTTQVVVPGSVILPASPVSDSMRVRVSAACGGGTTGATKSWRPFVNGLALAALTGTTLPVTTREADLIASLPGQIGMITVGGSGSSMTSVAVNPTTELTITNALTVSAAADFATILVPPAVLLFER